MRLTLYRIRIFSAAFVSALYAVFMFAPKLDLFYSGLFKVLFSFLIVFLSFKTKSFLHYIKVLCVFYLVTLSFAGTSFALFFMIGGRFGGILSNGVIYMNIPLYLIMTSAIISYLIIRLAIFYLKRRAYDDNATQQLRITLNGKSITATAFLDTGNTLCDPISKLPVVIVEYLAIKPILPPEINALLVQAGGLGNLDLTYDLPIPIKVIPFRALGVESGLLIGVIPHKLELVTKTYTKDLGKTIVGISNGCFPMDKEYNALINPQTIYQ